MHAHVAQVHIHQVPGATQAQRATTADCHQSIDWAFPEQCLYCVYVHNLIQHCSAFSGNSVDFRAVQSCNSTCKSLSITRSSRYFRPSRRREDRLDIMRCRSAICSASCRARSPPGASAVCCPTGMSCMLKDVKSAGKPIYRHCKYTCHAWYIHLQPAVNLGLQLAQALLHIWGRIVCGAFWGGQPGASMGKESPALQLCGGLQQLLCHLHHPLRQDLHDLPWRLHRWQRGEVPPPCRSQRSVDMPAFESPVLA